MKKQKELTAVEYERIKRIVQRSANNIGTIIKDELALLHGDIDEKCYLVTMVTSSGRYFTKSFKTDNFFKMYSWIRRLHPKTHLVSYHEVGEAEFEELSIIDNIESQLELEGYNVTHTVFK